MKKFVAVLFAPVLFMAALLVASPAHADRQYVYDGWTLATEKTDSQNTYKTPVGTVQPTTSPAHEARLTVLTGSVHFRASGDKYDYNGFNPGVGLVQPIYHDWLSVGAGGYYNSYRRLSLYAGLVLEPTVYEWSRGKLKLGGQFGLASGYRSEEISIAPFMGSFMISYMYKDAARHRDMFGVDLLFVPAMSSSSGFAALQFSVPLGFGLY